MSSDSTKRAERYYITLLQPDIYVLPTMTAVSTRFLAMHINVFNPSDQI